MTIDQPLTTGSAESVPPSAPPPVPPPAEVATGAAVGIASRARVWIVGTGLAVAATTVAGLLVWLPWGARNEFDHESIAPIRDTAWLGITLDGLAMGVLAVTVALASCMITPGRGGRWADVGAVITVLGGIAFAMGAFARGVLSWFATTESIGADAGGTLLALVTEAPTRLLLVAMAGYLSVTVGTLILTVAWWRSRVLPRWLPITFAVLTVAQFTGFEGRALDVLQIVTMLTLVVFAVLFVARASTR